MNGTIVRPDESFEKAMKRFSRVCEHCGVLTELKKNRHYEKPSEERKRKRKRNAAQQRLRREKTETNEIKNRKRR